MTSRSKKAPPMLFVESDKIYSLQKRHRSDSIAHCARRALKNCKQGDGILCMTESELVTVKKTAGKKQIPILERKQQDGGWLVFPLFYKSPQLKHKYVKTNANNDNGEKTQNRNP